MRQSGFTLVEIAIVIAIIAVLAAVAIPRMGSATATAERSMIHDMTHRLSSAAAMYAADHNGGRPQDFGDFVTTGTPVNPYTVSTANFGKNTCQVSATRIRNCSFKTYNGVEWTYHPDGSITVTGAPCCGNTLALTTP